MVTDGFYYREYKRVPEHLKDDDVIPNVSEIPSMFTSIRHPRRRAVSIGPQSEADAYEALAYREQRRRLSASSPDPPQIPRSSPSVVSHKGGESPLGVASANAHQPHRSVNRSPLRLDQYEHMMGSGTTTYEQNGTDNAADGEIQSEQQMFSMITRPRVRYDVEVVTKLIVYSGK